MVVRIFFVHPEGSHAWRVIIDSMLNLQVLQTILVFIFLVANMFTSSVIVENL